MRGLDESTRENLLEGAEAGTRRVRRFWTAFADFAFQVSSSIQRTKSHLIFHSSKLPY